MNYTENYHLPQWEETDRIMRTDFNAAMTKLEEGITAAQGTADTASIPAYQIGRYVGTLMPQKITLGFRPRAILIARSYNQAEESDAAISMGECSAFLDGESYTVVTFENDGFWVNAPITRYPRINSHSQIFIYVAFR